MQKDSIIILAGGFGTRMKSAKPKVLHKICGREMIFCIIDECLKISDDVNIILFNEFEHIKAAISEEFSQETAKINFFKQDYENFPGTAGCLMQGFLNKSNPKALIPLKYPNAIILSGDMPLISSEILNRFSASQNELTMGILELNNASGYGRVIMDENRVKKIIEEKDASDEIKRINLANAGIYRAKIEFLKEFLAQVSNKNAQCEFYLSDLIAFGESKGCQIYGIKAGENEFIGVNSKLDLARAEHFMLDKIRQKFMQNGVIMHLPNSIYIESGVVFEGECEIEPNCVFKGKSLIKDSFIKSNSVVENAEIISSQIGPFARIRPKSQIKHSQIGNFVEAKAAKMDGVKAGHLSYLGDCKIQNGTNVGAGVITCNYDGMTKHKTEIGENVFIGSDCQLVAPIKIESNAIIAAGSTITRDVKNGDLAISRARQENKAGFFYKFFRK